LSEQAVALQRIEAAQESDVVQQALTAARERLSMDAAYVATFDSQHQTIDAIVGDTEALGVGQDALIPIEQTYCRRMLDGEIPNVVPDTRAEPAIRDLLATRTIGAYVGVPVTLSDGRLHGTLCVASSEARPGLGDEELRFMQVLAGIIGARVDRAEGDVTRLLQRFRNRQPPG
jgi:GAF domain-containing protein